MAGELESLLDKQAMSLKQEENNMLGRFKQKLAELERQVASERGGQERAASEWMEKTVRSSRAGGEGGQCAGWGAMWCCA